MKLNQSFNLRNEDYPDQSAWIGRLFVVLNTFMTSIAQIFDQNIDFTTNIKSVSKDFDTTSPTYPITFQWPFTQAPPVELRVTVATKDNQAIVLLPAWSYNASTQAISISYLCECTSSGTISATSTGPRYKFTIRVTI